MAYRKVQSLEVIFPERITKEAVLSLNHKLNIQKDHFHEHTWEYDAADASRVDEFLALYEQLQLHKEEKFALMSLIIVSYNDAIHHGRESVLHTRKLKFHLLNDIDIHRNTIYSWALLETGDREAWYPITPIMRAVACLEIDESDLVISHS